MPEELYRGRTQFLRLQDIRCQLHTSSFVVDSRWIFDNGCLSETEIILLELFDILIKYIVKYGPGNIQSEDGSRKCYSVP